MTTNTPTPALLNPPADLAVTWPAYAALCEEFQRQIVRAEVIPGLKEFFDAHTKAQNAAAEEMHQFADSRVETQQRFLTEMAVQIFCDRTSASTRLSSLPEAYIKAVDIAFAISDEVAKRARPVGV